MDIKTISPAVIRRLPRYYRYLGELMRQNVERISSGDLSQKMNVTASQIRQDLNNFGGFGQQGYGYNVEYLHAEIGKILGLDREHHSVIIGAGNIARALANYKGFQNIGFYFDAFFDSDSSLWEKDIAGLPIYPMEELANYVNEHHPDFAVLAIPKQVAEETAKYLVECGITAIWNFAHVDLHLPEHIQVENVHLSESLMLLSYDIHNAVEED